MTDASAAPVADVATALAHAGRLLASAPPLAEAQAREILDIVPGHPQARLILGAAMRKQGDAAGALAVLEPLAIEQHAAPDAQFELGLALGVTGRSREAIEALRRTVALRPGHAAAWRALGDMLSLIGDTNASQDAYARHIRASVNDPRLIEAATALCDDRLAVAERLLRAFIKAHPTDVAALRMLAETGARLGRYEDAEALLERCLELAPGFTVARHNYATVLQRRNRPAETVAQVDILLGEAPGNPGYLYLKAAALGRLGEFEPALDIYKTVLKSHPDQPKAWMSYGHALKAVGRLDESVAAYRDAIRRLPSLGESYWSLANLKTFRFTPDEVAAMAAQLARKDIDDEDRFHLHYALGKALEDAGDYAAAFDHYARGAALRREGVDYDADETTDQMRRTKALFTPDFLAARAGSGSSAPDPIFVVGLPRSGSTLIEQILASHSRVEGTMELPDIIAMSKRLGGKARLASESTYPEALGELEGSELKALGEEYLERTRVQRKSGRPLFIDKMPNNFAHAGFIHMILPKARIIDARRHPLGCCFSNFKQHFARGQTFTYDLTDLGRYYADYVELMDHFDEVLPGRVHRIFYERMVADPEREVRRLLDYCGLPFEDQCLRFYENERAVRTASSEQVRQPIYADAADHWRHFEPWLAPLKQALGPALANYSAAD